MSVRSKVHRDWQLIGNHRQVAEEFISLPPPGPAEQRVYEAAWKIELAFDELKAGRGLIGKRERRQQARALRRRAHKLVSAPRRAAAPSRMEIHRAALRYLRRYGDGDNFNISNFVKYVQTRPAANRMYRQSGSSRTLTDHAIRAILKQRLGIVGKPGRKRKKP